ncbi:MAG: hypothetical protein ACYDFT_01915 [Thermoplasmata archaeon]
MTAQTVPSITLEHLTPHDLVTYYRCPHELELAHVRRQSMAAAPGSPTEALVVRTPLDVVPLRHSPLEAPIFPSLPVNEGRLDIFPADRLVYEDEGEEEELPMLFASEQVRPDPVFRQHGFNLVDTELGLSGRPDFIVQRPGAGFIPVEYKSTHPFRGLHEVHGRTFDLIQLLAECRLIEAVTGHRPSYGLLLYGDTAGSGAHEGWVSMPYGDREAAWIRSAVAQVRHDSVRAPVPVERTCSTCPPHREGLCRYAVGRYDGTEPARDRFHRMPAAGFHR